MREVGVYLHIPFCEAKCPYCVFYSRPASETVRAAYVETLRAQILGWNPGETARAKTLYFGGGTPSLLSSEQLLSLREAVAARFGEPEETTLEANPGLCSREQLAALRRGGFNRLSLGVQSLSDEELNALGRRHTAEQALKAIEQAARAGFANISADVMLAIPGQTPESLSRTLGALTLSPITHLSAYLLKIEAGTPFDRPELNALTGDEARCEALYLQTVEQLERAGFLQYEISNFARSGFESRHNLLYWRGQEYLGFGPAAHSFYQGRRFCCPDDLGDFLSTGGRTVVLEERVNPAEERVLLGLRLKEGISLRFTPALEALCAQCVRAGLMERQGSRIFLTPRGNLVSNQIIVRILGCMENEE